MRFFNYHGSVNPQQHYFITRSKLLAQLMVQLERGKFFSIVQLVGERNDNFATLLRHVNRLREPVMQILVGEPVRYNLNYEPVYQMEMYGIVRQVENYCEIANPIYKKVITENLRPPETDLQTETVRNGLAPPDVAQVSKGKKKADKPH
jgi:hypothetical protein